MVIEPGHLYMVPNLEQSGHQFVRFIRRSSAMIKHPTDYPGCNTQDIIRVCIDRTKYLNSVGGSEETQNAVHWLRMALYEYESRAWQRKQQGVNKSAEPQAQTDRINAHRDGYRDIPFSEYEIESKPVGIDGHLLIVRNRS